MAAEVWDWDAPPVRTLTRCRRSAFLHGLHLHVATVPPEGATHPRVLIAWRSGSAPDYHVDHVRDPGARLVE